MSRSFSCPACGAPLEVENRFSRSVICAYCNQGAFITPGGLDPAGRGVQLVGTPSMLRIGARGSLEGEPCHVLGRLRYGYAGGYWDEWFVSLAAGARQLWLQEDDGVLTAFEKVAIDAPLAPFEAIEVGQSLDLGERSLFVTERTEAMILGGEGELGFAVLPGADVYCVDGVCDGETWSIEYQPDEITLSRGHPLASQALRLD